MVIWASTVCAVAVVCSMNFVIDKVNSHITVCLFLYPIHIFCPLFWTYIVFLSSVMVQSLSHRTPKDIIGDIFIDIKMLILLDSIDSPYSGKVATGVEFMMLPSGSLAAIVCSHLSEEILVGA